MSHYPAMVSSAIYYYYISLDIESVKISFMYIFASFMTLIAMLTAIVKNSIEVCARKTN